MARTPWKTVYRPFCHFSNSIWFFSFKPLCINEWNFKLFDSLHVQELCVVPGDLVFTLNDRMQWIKLEALVLKDRMDTRVCRVTTITRPHSRSSMMIIDVLKTSLLSHYLKVTEKVIGTSRQICYCLFSKFRVFQSTRWEFFFIYPEHAWWVVRSCVLLVVT